MIKLFNNLLNLAESNKTIKIILRILITDKKKVKMMYKKKIYKIMMFDLLINNHK
jgi:hypothetical protein